MSQVMLTERDARTGLEVGHLVVTTIADDLDFPIVERLSPNGRYGLTDVRPTGMRRDDDSDMRRHTSTVATAEHSSRRITAAAWLPLGRSAEPSWSDRTYSTIHGDRTSHRSSTLTR